MTQDRSSIIFAKKQSAANLLLFLSAAQLYASNDEFSPVSDIFGLAMFNYQSRPYSDAFSVQGMFYVDAATIKSMIESGLPGSKAMVTGDDGVHFAATVICDDFDGNATLKRHRMVYATLGDKMGGEIHALSLTTLTAQEAA